MNLLIAGIILRGSTHDPYIDLLIFSIAIVIGVISFVSQRWSLFAQRIDGVRGRDWPSVSASVDVVSVLRQTEESEGMERTIGYLATLTYFYRNPELQAGEYSRMFDNEEEARAWADSYKGSTVKVHVDPHEPSRSVLRERDL